MWGIAVIIAACCLAFGAADAASKLHEKKKLEKSTSTEDLTQSNDEIIAAQNSGQYHETKETSR